MPALTSLRFFAAFLVVLYHYAAGFPLPSFLKNIVHNGSAGVPFFFILSGFVLAYNYHEWKISARRFYWLRFVRIYPAYILSLLIALPPYLAEYGTSSFGRDIFTRAFMLQMWFPGETLKWNGPAWSLSCEAFFYLLFPALIIGLVRLKRGYVALAVLFIVGYAFLGLPSNPIKYTFLFAAGICLCLAFLQGFRLPAFWPSIIAAVAMMGLFDLSGQIEGLTICLVFAVVILAGADKAGSMAHPGLLLLGEASYCLYILHEPLGSYLHWVAKRMGTSLNEPAPLAFSLAFAVLVSVAVFKWFDRPVNRALRKMA